MHLFNPAESCHGYVWLNFKLFFVLGQFLNILAVTGTNKLYLWVNWANKT